MSLAEAQMRMTEISISQRIAHNLARYKSGQSTAYTVPQFIRDCEEVMEDFRVPIALQRSILTRAKALMQQDLVAIKQSKHLASDGGAECTAYALLSGPLTMLVSQLEAAAARNKN